MTRRLEGRVFFTDDNNGVNVITPKDYSEETAQLVKRLCDYYDSQTWPQERRVNAVDAVLKVALAKPIFTFTSTERAEKRPWFTGSHELGQRLFEYIQDEGGTVRHAGVYVPFSNGYESYLHSLEILQSELRWVTTETQFMEEFGISREELLTRVVVV